MPKTVRPLTDSIGPGNLHFPEVVSGRVRIREGGGGTPGISQVRPAAGGTIDVIQSDWMSHVRSVATGGFTARIMLGWV